MSLQSMPTTVGHLLRHLGRWTALLGLIVASVGSVVAFFLWSLDQVTTIQWHQPWLLYLLPLAGCLTGWVYHRWGSNSEAGNNLVYQQVRAAYSPNDGASDATSTGDPRPTVPARMAPLVLAGTLLTHLFGGSAGREGTAIQIGASVAGTLGRWLRIDRQHWQLVLQMGIAAGFGAVFGTPLAATIFAFEVVGAQYARWHNLPLCLLAGLLADAITSFWGIGHTHYSIAGNSLEQLSTIWFLSTVVAGLAFGSASLLFVELTHWIGRMLKHPAILPWLRPAIGGVVVVAAVWLLQTREYLGLGVAANPNSPDAVSILSSFQADGSRAFSWFWKTLLTAITVGSGFKGGEATPLFFVGASLGGWLSGWVGLPVDLLAGLGFVAVFAAATRTPLASSLMALELFADGLGTTATFQLALLAAWTCGIATVVNVWSTPWLRQQQSDIRPESAP